MTFDNCLLFPEAVGEKHANKDILLMHLRSYCWWKTSCITYNLWNLWKKKDILHINWCRISSINSISRSLLCLFVKLQSTLTNLTCNKIACCLWWFTLNSFQTKTTTLIILERSCWGDPALLFTTILRFRAGLVVMKFFGCPRFLELNFSNKMVVSQGWRRLAAL